MVVEILIHDDEYPNGNSWRYGFSSISDAIEFMSENYSSLKDKGRLTPRALDRFQREPAVFNPLHGTYRVELPPATSSGK